MGFSKGWAELTLKKPPPLVPSCLMATCEAAGPSASVCSVTTAWSAPAVESSRVGLYVGPEGLHHALRDEQQRQHERERQQHVERAAGEVDPEVADPVGLGAGEAADQRHQHRHAGRRRDEVLHREPEHLGEVAQGGLAAVGLPVGVGGEADRGVERELGRHRAEARRVERQHALQPLQRVDDEQAEEVEHQHRRGVALPAHVLVGPHAGEAIEEALERPEHALGELRLAGEDARHVSAERHRERHQHDEVEGQLNQGVHDSFSGESRANSR